MPGSGFRPLQNLSTTNYLAKTLSLHSEQKEKWIHHWIKKGLTAFEKMLSPHSGKYCLGDDISCADLFLIPQIFSARRFGVKTSSHPLLASIEENCMIKDAFTQSVPDQTTALQISFILLTN